MSERTARGQLTFEEVLEICLQETLQATSIDEVLQRYPHEALRLRPLLEEALALRQYYAAVPAPPQGLITGRRRMVAEAERMLQSKPLVLPIQSHKETKPKMVLSFAGKVVALAIAAMLGITSVGASVALAASDSLPGELVYPAKLAIERLQLRIAARPAEQAALALDQADTRISEVQALAVDGQDVPPETMAHIEERLRLALRHAADSAHEDTPALLAQIAQRTERQARLLEQLRSQAQDRNQVRLEEALRICQQVNQEAQAGLGDAEAFRYRYQLREGGPDDVTPPEPPVQEPQGTAEPQQNQEQNQAQQDQEQDQTQQQNQEQNQAQQQDQCQEPGQCQQQDQTQQQNQEQDQTQQQDQQQDQTQQQDQEQDQTQQQDQQQDQTQQQSGQR